MSSDNEDDWATEEDWEINFDINLSLETMVNQAILEDIEVEYTSLDEYIKKYPGQHECHLLMSETFLKGHFRRGWIGLYFYQVAPDWAIVHLHVEGKEDTIKICLLLYMIVPSRIACITHFTFDYDNYIDGTLEDMKEKLDFNAWKILQNHILEALGVGWQLFEGSAPRHLVSNVYRSLVQDTDLPKDVCGLIMDKLCQNMTDTVAICPYNYQEEIENRFKAAEFTEHVVIGWRRDLPMW